MKVSWKRPAKFTISCFLMMSLNVDRAAQNHFTRAQIYALRAPSRRRLSSGEISPSRTRPPIDPNWLIPLAVWGSSTK